MNTTHSLEDRILRMEATNVSDLPDFPDNKSDLPSDFEYDPAEYDDEEEEIVEEISENELLRYLDQQENPLSVAQRLFYHELNTTQYQRQSDTWDLNCLTPQALEELYGTGWTELEGIVDLDTLKGAHEEAVSLQDAYVMPKDLRAEDDPFRDVSARDDAIVWLDPNNENNALGTVDTPPYLSRILEFISGPLYHDLSKMIRLQGRTEYQLAYYHPNGARYERHRDALPTDDPSDGNQRRVTVVLYLNPGWVAGDGGEVKILSRTDDHGLPEGADRIVKPQMGKILLFLSGVVDYEVLPTHKPRYALTTWLR
ncbi:hypothetical protein INT47_002126 [Mucor saturninus]|uniref:Fe2OG dioxygenase domain-containing protein n=1 Tax=Mucor saturninus TaxID=64648 RepID=A0A8H7V1P9_9FUNG|nr:hypothetical protein INT47_002126 [Mucor saturninus]